MGNFRCRCGLFHQTSSTDEVYLVNVNYKEKGNLKHRCVHCANNLCVKYLALCLWLQIKIKTIKGEKEYITNHIFQAKSLNCNLLPSVYSTYALTEKSWFTFYFIFDS